MCTHIFIFFVIIYIYLFIYQLLIICLFIHLYVSTCTRDHEWISAKVMKHNNPSKSCWFPAL